MALEAMGAVGIDKAEWKARPLRGAAATHFMARGVPGAVFQARDGWGIEKAEAQYLLLGKNHVK